MQMAKNHSKPTTLWIRATMFAMAGMVVGIALAVDSFPEDGATKSVFRVLSYAGGLGAIGAFLAAYTSPHGFTERYKKEFRQDMAWSGLWFALVGVPVLLAFGSVPMVIALTVGMLGTVLCKRAKRRRMSGHVSSAKR